jgi:hypothetical protein
VIPLDALMRRPKQPTPSGTARRDRYKRKEVVTILYELERQNKVRARYLIAVVLIIGT